MRNKFKAAYRLLVAVLVLVISSRSFSQEMVKMCAVTSSDLNAKFTSLAADGDFKLLLNGLKEKGWTKLTAENYSYGFTGTYMDSITKTTVPVEFYAFDFFNKATNQMGSIIWRNNGKTVYKAYLIFAAGEKDMGKALQESVEMFAEGGKVQKASSWSRCFNSCASAKCAHFCIAAAAVCAVSAAAGGAGVAAWAACAGITCGLCFAVCALGCH